MDYNKVGKLIMTLRKERKMTQKALADSMNLSDRTISKWERGQGCPDVSLLPLLSDRLGVNIEKILLGDLEPNIESGGNMNRVRFYVCPACGNVLFSSGDADISCCGRKLAALKAKPVDDCHTMAIEAVEDEYYVTINHEMTKEHFISFMAYVSFDRIVLVKLYPEQNAEVRFEGLRKGRLFTYCSRHGLLEQRL